MGPAIESVISVAEKSFQEFFDALVFVHRILSVYRWLY